MINTLVKLIKKYKRNPVKTMLFFTSILVAIITVSVGISSIEQLKILAYEKNDGVPDNTRVVDINLNKTVDHEQIKAIFKEVPEYCNVNIIKRFTYIDKASKYIGYPLIIHVRGDNTTNPIPILKGSYFKNNKKGNKDILIGYELEEFTEGDNENKKIRIYGEEYNVIGTLGYKNRATNWENRIILDLEDITKNNLDELKNGSFMVQIESDKGDIVKVCENFKKDLESSGENVLVNISEIGNKDQVYSTLLSHSKSFFKMIIIVYLISIINLIFISTGWVNTIHNEIGIMKVCGMSNFFIIRRIFMEFFVISLSATIGAIIFQYILSSIISRIDLLYFYISPNNILLGIGVAAITTTITLIVPIIQLIKMTPVKFLRN
ncbi:ABC transporter permease [Clostridium septicum]|uniref:ABC transporter permease n=1 Tax=Clostridium septicum TaxID=1504 RepID=UPI000FF8C6A6|nr:ABC transporter permease [Clostridium septicum]QAS59405.1 ABC transporter permease [Clostridium septicum]